MESDPGSDRRIEVACYVNGLIVNRRQLSQCNDSINPYDLDMQKF